MRITAARAVEERRKQYESALGFFSQGSRSALFEEITFYYAFLDVGDVSSGSSLLSLSREKFPRKNEGKRRPRQATHSLRLPAPLFPILAFLFSISKMYSEIQFRSPCKSNHGRQLD